MPGQTKPTQTVRFVTTRNASEHAPLLQKRDIGPWHFSNIAPILVTTFVVTVIFCMPGLPGEGVSFLVGNRWFPPVHPTCGVGVPNLRWCRTSPGFHIACPRNDKFCDSICRWGYWEHATTRSLGFPSTPKGDVVDVGANVGWYSMLFAQAGYKVHSFEALTSNVQMLNASICANPQFANLMNVHSATLAAEPVARCKVWSSTHTASNGTVCCPVDECPAAKNPSYKLREHIMSTSTLDTELSKITEPLAFLKLDVEGYECQVLKGARETFQRIAPQYVKADIRNKEVRCGSDEYLALLRSLGYTVKFAESGGGFLASTYVDPSRYETASSLGLFADNIVEILAQRNKEHQ